MIRDGVVVLLFVRILRFQVGTSVYETLLWLVPRVLVLKFWISDRKSYQSVEEIPKWEKSWNFSYVVLDAEGKALGLLRETDSRARPRRAASASKTTYEKFHDFPF